MKKILYPVLALLCSCGGPQKKQAAEEPVAEAEMLVSEPEYFELRTYYCYPGKLEDLLSRFEDHTMALFEKHGMVNMAYWVPLENSENKLVYLMGYPDRASRDRSWAAFAEDPEWKAVWEASRANGPIVDSVTQHFMTYTDYSPRMAAADASPRIFSLRTYYTFPGKLEGLNARFRDHTMEIFTRNGMTNIGYFLMDPEDPGHENILKYLITFPDTAARTASWKSFGDDPAWKAAYENSIRDGRLVDSITADLLVPTRFSPIK